MSVVDVQKNLDTAQLTLVAELSVPVATAWKLYEDQKLVEKWWGPPGYPATFTNHDLTPGATVGYYMTGPDGEKYHGLWQVQAVTPEREIHFTDRFADAHGQVDAALPASDVVVTFESLDGDRSRITTVTTMSSPEDLEEVLKMGAEEGTVQAMNQMDALLGSAT